MLPNFLRNKDPGITAGRSVRANRFSDANAVNYRPARFIGLAEFPSREL